MNEQWWRLVGPKIGKFSSTFRLPLGMVNPEQEKPMGGPYTQMDLRLFAFSIRVLLVVYRGKFLYRLF